MSMTRLSLSEAARYVEARRITSIKPVLHRGDCQSLVILSVVELASAHGARSTLQYWGYAQHGTPQFARVVESVAPRGAALEALAS
jgi:hypothetical protein